jgi:hypothetical protein
MTMWEYKGVQVQRDGPSADMNAWLEFLTELNSAGEDGWEAISIGRNYAPGGMGSPEITKYEAVLKRPLS